MTQEGNHVRIAIIGGGAAGCFCAIGAKRRLPEADVTLYEAGPKLLAKVALTGGGRCNLTNSFRDVERLGEAYPRGEQLMRRALRVLSPEATQRWWEAEGVRLVTQEDQCVFPVSQDAMQIVRTLERDLRVAGVAVRLRTPVERVEALPEGGFAVGDSPVKPANDERYDCVVVTVGGCSREKLERLLPAGVAVTPCVPSLFTLKIPDEGLRALMGTVVEQAALSLAGTKFRAAGTLLLTDWGVSGPATLRLSSYGARYLAGRQYRGTLLISWLGSSEAEVREQLEAAVSGSRMIVNSRPDGLTERLWRHLVSRAGIAPERRWNELGSKGWSRLVNTLTADAYEITGRARFKEEFVTCGGVSLEEIDPDTMVLRRTPGIYCIGEVLDTDAVTGGFNLQAAWSTAFTAARGL